LDIKEKHSMEIRLMRPPDYASVYKLWQDTEGMGLNSTDDTEDAIRRYLARNPGTSFVAEKNYEIIGALLCGTDGRRGYIYHAAVHREYRNLGAGRAMLQAAMQALAAEGISKAALVVFASNASGNRFWEQNGFAARTDLVYRNKFTESLPDIR
jgi:N-acetylglutamate synthase